MALWPLAAHFGVVVGLVGAILGISALLGERHRERATGEPYESGLPPTGTARLRFSPHFYVVGLLFVLFDLEVAFLFAWVAAASELGWPGFAGMAAFVVILLVGLVYEWRQGALDWGPRPRPGPATGGRR